MEREDCINDFFSSNKGKKLLNLDKKVLAEALYKASLRNGNVHLVLERLTSSDSENRVRFRERLKEYKRSGRFTPRYYTGEFVSELEDLLIDLKESTFTPEEGLSLVKEFFEVDGDIMESCDDSDGEVGDIFNYNATDLFREYAKQCKDKKWVTDILLNLIVKDDYGLREKLSVKVDEFLPEKEIRRVIDRLWNLHESNKNKGYLYLLECMAKTIKDPFLYEKIIDLSGEKDNDNNFFKLGKMWFFCGDPNKALFYLQKINKDNYYGSSGNLDDLLLKIYTQLGDKKKQKEISWKMFRSYRKKEKFDEVVAIEGNSKRPKLLKNEVALIFRNKQLEVEDVNFMLELKLIDESGDYIFKRRQHVNGDYYHGLVKWADIFNKNKKPLIATIIYRALLDSILDRGKSPAYHHGVDYLRCLDRINKDVKDWMGVQTHDAYFLEVKKNHGRKYSFWGQYNSN